MSTEQKKPADYTMRDGTPWWKFETMMPPSMDAPILLMNHESGAITPHKDGRYLYDEKDLWTPMPPEAPKATPSLPASPELPESVYAAVFYALDTGRHQSPEEHRMLTRSVVAALTPLWPSADGKKERHLLPDAVKREWVKCPVCGEPDMRREEDKNGDALILCVNHACASNGGGNADALKSSTPSPVAGLPTPESGEPRACPICQNDGFWVDVQPNRHTGDAEQVQVECEFCSTKNALAAARAEVEQWKKNYYDVADALTRESSSPANLCQQARDLRAQLATAKEELEKRNKQLATIVSDETFPRTSLFDELTMQKLRSELAKANAEAATWKDNFSNAVEQAHKECAELRERAAESERCERQEATENENLRAQLAAQQSVPPDDRYASLGKMYDNLVKVCEAKLGVSSLLAEPIEFQVERVLSVPPEARAVEAAEKIRKFQEDVRGGYETYDESVAAIIQRTCFPPGEGEEWAKAIEIMRDIAEMPRYDQDDIYRLYDKAKRGLEWLKKHAPARPTAAREAEYPDSGRFMQWAKDSGFPVETWTVSDSVSFYKFFEEGWKKAVEFHDLGVSEDTAAREDTARREAWKDCAEYGWAVIANASGGNWEKQSKDWQEAAARFRDQYHACLHAAMQQGGKTP